MQRKDKTDILEKLVASNALTEDGKNWLKTALDPFHDYNCQIAGYPDVDVSQTVVSCYQYQQEIVAPAGVAGNWDAHIFNTPVCLPQFAAMVQESADWAYCKYPAIAVNNSIGPICVCTAASAAVPNLVPTIPFVANTALHIIPAIGGEEIASGNSRVIGFGYEVHNTTAEIYKQGAITNYRMPQSSGIETQPLFDAVGNVDGGIITAHRYRMPPGGPSQANLLKGTRSWEAKDGVYATCLQGSVTNPLKQLSNIGAKFAPEPDPGLTQNVWITAPKSSGAAAAMKYTSPPNNFMPYDTTGTFFTGLSNQTTLMVKVRIYVERAPTWIDANIAVLASPSAAYDVRALEIYGAAINMLPAGVKVGENAKGDWWRAVLNVVKAVAAPAGMALNPFVPGAGLVGGLVTGMLGQIDTKRPISTQVAKQQITRRLKPPAKKPQPKKKPVKAPSKG